MSDWNIVYSKAAKNDLASLDGSVRPEVLSAIRKIAKNPLPKRENGYGNELGNKHGIDLTGCLKIKLKKSGIRIIYQINKIDDIMKIIIIGMRADDIVYKEAAKRLGR